VTAQAATDRLTTTNDSELRDHAAATRRARARARRKRRARHAGWTPADRRGQGPAAYGRRVATPFRVQRAVPPGHRVAVDLRHWLGAVREAALTDFRTDAAERRICLAAVLARHTDWPTATARTGWGLLADRGCVSRSTVARFLSWLRARDLIGVVSTGRVGSLTRPMALTDPATPATPPPRTAGPTPTTGGRDAGADTGTTSGDWEGNEAAVYVLVEPIPTPRPVQEPDPGLLALDPRYTAGLLGVDPHGRAVDLTRLGPLAADQLHDPALAGLRRHHHLRAAHQHPAVERTDTPKMSRGAGTQSAREPACSRCHRPPAGPLRGGNNATSWPHLPEPGQPTPRPVPPVGQTTPPPPDRRSQPVGPCPCRGQWSRDAPARTRRDRLHLTDRLLAIAPDLTGIGSARLLRHLLRPWLEADWTINDVFLAIENHPTTGLRPHSPTITTTGPGAVRHPAGWLLARMRDWTQPDGTPTPNHATRTAHATATRTLAEHHQRHTDNQTKAARVPPTPEWTAARDALHDRLHATRSTSA
jgi:hypothetical protein